MKPSLHARIELITTDSAPAPWNGGKRLRLDHVISRTVDGAIASRFGDLVWDWEAYRSRGRSRFLNFAYWIRNTRLVAGQHVTPQRLLRVREMQHLMALLLYKRNGMALSSSSTSGYLTALVRLAQFAEKRGIAISEVFSSEQQLGLSIHASRGSAAAMLFRWCNLLREIGPADVGFSIPEQCRNAEELRRRAEDYRKSKKQRAPLPTRIYSEFIQALSTELDEIEGIVDELSAAVGRLASTRCRFSSKPSTKREKRGIKDAQVEMRKAWSAELQEYCQLRGYREHYGALIAMFADIQLVCKLAIHTFTGMRSAEATYLPFHCVEHEEGRDGQAHIVLAGTTTKLEGGRERRVRWVTNQVGRRGALIAQKSRISNLRLSHPCSGEGRG